MLLTSPGWPLLVAISAVPPLAAVAILMPTLYWALLGLAGAAAAVALVFLHPTACIVVWLLITGATVEMALLDLIGPAAFQTTIAIEKAAGIGLAAVGACRWGVRLDPLNPAWAFLAMGALGLAVGLHPDLPRDDSLRSLFGSLAPFAFCFCRIPPSKALTLQAAISWCPVLAVAMGVVLAVLGLRPLFVDSGGLRLAGVGHPAFLAGVALVGVYASLLAMYREDRPASRYLLVANLMILLLTGARAPLACAAAVILLSLLIVPSRAIDAAKRGFLLLAAVCAVPVILALGADLSEVRVINLLSTDATHLSGRERLWPLFEAAADSAPWFGWGIGAGNIVVPPGSAVAKLLRTWAAHNEYLRIRVEGGWIGLGALIMLFVLWVGMRSARLPPGERWIMRFVFLALAVHAVTDNVLISTPACVLFTFAAAVFATAEERPPRHDPDGGRGRPVADGDAGPGPL